ncbi:MAG: hypothetical protein R3Y32_00325 [Bacillota bacterium]
MAKKDFKKNPVMNFFTSSQNSLSDKKYVQEVRTSQKEELYVQTVRTHLEDEVSEPKPHDEHIRENNSPQITEAKESKSYGQNVRAESTDKMEVPSVRTKRTDNKGVEIVRTERTYSFTKSKEIRSERLELRISPSLKSLATKKAQESEMSLSEMIIYLLENVVGEEGELT